MSTTFTGDPTQVSNSLSATVNGATNASPIVISTSAAHLFYDGDTVSVSGVTGNTAANTVAVIAVLSATSFSMIGTTGNGAYVSGGTAVDVSLTPGFTIPSDGDALDVASVNTAIETLGDRTQFLNQQVSTQPSTYYFSTAGTHTFRALRTGLYRCVAVGGGGGGGGGMGSSGAGASAMGSGSGGGAGARSESIAEFTAGDTVTVTIAAAAAGGTAGDSQGIVPAGAGADGVATTIKNASFTTVCQGNGGGGGLGGEYASNSATTYQRGGLSPANFLGSSSAETESTCVGAGGTGRRAPATSQPLAVSGSMAGGNSNCSTGGLAGTEGVKSTTNAGGAPGGGGGAADVLGSIGGDGGNGGAGSATTGGNGTDGADGSTAGGGGGGGAGGAGAATANGAGGVGGDGGLGVAEVTYLGPVA